MVRDEKIRVHEEEDSTYSSEWDCFDADVIGGTPPATNMHHTTACSKERH